LHDRSILVTGADGLIGRAAIARSDPACRIYALVKEQRERPLPAHSVALVHDLRRREDPPLSEAPETVIHLAQSARFRDFPDGADDVFEVNVGSTQRLLDWACRRNVKRFIYASSGGVYGRGKQPFREDAPLGAAASIGHYLASKQCGELIAQAYAGRMIVIVLRLFFVYGPAQNPTMLIPRLIGDVAHGRPISLQGPDGIRINPTYVTDAVDAIWSAAALPMSVTINIAGPQVRTIREIAGIASEHVGRHPQFSAQPGDGAGDLVASIDKMTDLLGGPKVAVSDGIRRMIGAPTSGEQEGRSECWPH